MQQRQFFNTTIMEEVKNDLLSDIRLSTSTKGLDILASGENKYLKDFRLNFKNVLKEGDLTESSIILIGVAVAFNNKNESLKQFFLEKARELEISDEHVADAIAAASLLSANNVLYRFRHYVANEDYQRQPAKLRMGVMMNPAIGKELFELISLAVSAVNGCEVCVASHENSLRELGVKKEQIWFAIRLASVLNSADRLIA